MKKTMKITLNALLAVFAAVSLAFLSCKSQAESDRAIVEDEKKDLEKISLNLDIHKLKELLEKAPDDFERSRLLGEIAGIQIYKGDVEEAMKSAKESAKLYPNNWKAHYVIGIGYMKLRRFAEAEEEFLVSIQLKGDYAPSHFELGNLYFMKRNTPGALAEYNLAVKYDPRHYYAHNNIGVIHFRMKNYPESERSLQTSVRIHPRFSTGYKNLAILYDLGMNRKDQAVLNYRRYLQFKPNAAERKSVNVWIQTLGG